MRIIDYFQHPLLLRLRGGGEQVLNLLVVQLRKSHLYHELSIRAAAYSLMN